MKFVIIIVIIIPYAEHYEHLQEASLNCLSIIYRMWSTVLCFVDEAVLLVQAQESSVLWRTIAHEYTEAASSRCTHYIAS